MTLDYQGASDNAITCYYKGVECIAGDNYFISYAGERISFGQVTVDHADYEALDLATSGDLVFENSDGSVITLQKIYCIKSISTMTDVELLPVTHTLILVDAKYFWKQRYISARYNIQKPDYVEFFPDTASSETVARARSYIMNAIVGDGNVSGASYSNELTGEVIAPFNVVFDNTDCFTAIMHMLKEANGYFALDNIGNTVKLLDYGKSSAAASAKLLDSVEYLDKQNSPGLYEFGLEPSLVPQTVYTVFSVFDPLTPLDFKNRDDRLAVIGSTNGRPAKFNSAINHTIYAQNLKMVRDSDGNFDRQGDMDSEADVRAETYFAQFQYGKDYVYNKAIDFKIDEVVTGVMWRFRDTKGNPHITPMRTWVRTDNFEAFPLDKNQMKTLKIIHETLYVDVDKAGDRHIIRARVGRSQFRSSTYDTPAFQASNGLITISMTDAGAQIIELDGNTIPGSMIKEVGNFLDTDLWVNFEKMHQMPINQVASTDDIEVGWWMYDATVGAEKIYVRTYDKDYSPQDDHFYGISMSGERA